MDFGLTAFEMVAIFSTMVIAYIIFGITGFGSALIASPVLALFMDSLVLCDITLDIMLIDKTFC